MATKEKTKKQKEEVKVPYSAAQSFAEYHGQLRIPTNTYKELKAELDRGEYFSKIMDGLWTKINEDDYSTKSNGETNTEEEIIQLKSAKAKQLIMDPNCVVEGITKDNIAFLTNETFFEAIKGLDLTVNEKRFLQFWFVK